jgi:hypothetical protein
VQDHVATVTGLTSNTRLFYGLGFPDPITAEVRFTPTDVVNTGVEHGHLFQVFKAVGVVYTDANPGPGYSPMNADRLAEARARYAAVADFYWRNSRFRLWLDIQVVEVARDLVAGQNPVPFVEPDLVALGFGPASELDAVWITTQFGPGNFGGGGWLFNRFVGHSQWVTPSDFVAIHEVNHSIDAIYDYSGLPGYQFNHGIWAIPGSTGHDFVTNGQILRNFGAANFTAAKAPFAKRHVAPDADGDGLPDDTVPGLVSPLSVTEAMLRTSTARADSDGDGVRDDVEASALTAHGTNPRSRNTDREGGRDAVDPNPAYRVTDRITRGSPPIDGVIRAARDGWVGFTRRSGYSNDKLIADTDALQRRTTTWITWDDRFLYLALRGPASRTRIRLDGNGDGWFLGPDNYLIEVRNDTPSLSVRINVAVPDLFRQIDDDGQFSEFFDTHPQFTRPYKGVTIFDHPDSGLGFPGRLVTESDLQYAIGGTGNDRVWELAIPWSNVTNFRPGVGRELRISFDIDEDLLFETDDMARFQLVD